MSARAARRVMPSAAAAQASNSETVRTVKGPLADAASCLRTPAYSLCLKAATASARRAARSSGVGYHHSWRRDRQRHRDRRRWWNRKSAKFEQCPDCRVASQALAVIASAASGMSCSARRSAPTDRSKRVGLGGRRPAGCRSARRPTSDAASEQQLQRNAKNDCKVSPYMFG